MTLEDFFDTCYENRITVTIEPLDFECINMTVKKNDSTLNSSFRYRNGMRSLEAHLADIFSSLVFQDGINYLTLDTMEKIGKEQECV